MTSRLCALVAFTNTLSLMEARSQNVLKFPPQVTLTLLQHLVRETTIFEHHVKLCSKSGQTTVQKLQRVLLT